MWDFDTVGNGGGESVEFGDMAWLVLDKSVDNRKKLLLSKRDFYESWLPEDSAEREAQNGDFTWEVSSARKYLNGQFIEQHFSNDEKERILGSKLENKGNPFGGDRDSEPTTDKVFMLSLEEAIHYFEANPEAENLAIAEGQLFYTRTPLNCKWPVSPVLFNLEEQWGEWEEDFDGEGDDRTGEIQNAFPNASGLAMYTLNAWVDYTEDTIGIRPAMWVAC